MYCAKCGKELPNDSNFCLNCGAKVIPEPTEKTSGLVASDDDIRVELKKYKNHKRIYCLECGYEGLVGISKEKITPLLIRIPIQIVLLVVSWLAYLAVTNPYYIPLTNKWFAGLVVFPAAIGITVYLNRCYKVCPKCKSKLK